MKKIVVCGSRNFTDYGLLKNVLDRLANAFHLVSGGAHGADALGERYALERGLEMTVVLAQWDKHGRSAGIKRNLEMLKIADAVIAFWDGQSRGTKHMIDASRKAGKQTAVVRCRKR